MYIYARSKSINRETIISVIKVADKIDELSEYLDNVVISNIVKYGHSKEEVRQTIKEIKADKDGTHKISVGGLCYGIVKKEKDSLTYYMDNITKDTDMIIHYKER